MPQLFKENTSNQKDTKTSKASSPTIRRKTQQNPVAKKRKVLVPMMIPIPSPIVVGNPYDGAGQLLQPNYSMPSYEPMFTPTMINYSSGLSSPWSSSSELSGTPSPSFSPFLPPQRNSKLWPNTFPPAFLNCQSASPKDSPDSTPSPQLDASPSPAKESKEAMPHAAASKDKKIKSGLYIPPHLKKKQEDSESEKPLFCQEESPEAAPSVQKTKPSHSEKKISVAEEAKRRAPQQRQKSPFQSYRERQNELDMSQLLQNQATLSLLAQQQQQLLSGHPSQNTAQTSQANLLLAAQLAQLQSLIPWAPAMAQTAPPGDLYAQLGATAQLLNPFMGFPAEGMYNPLLGTPMATGWPQQTQQNHRPSHKSSQKFPKQGGNRSTGVTPQTPSNPGKSPFGMSTLETQLIDIINGQAQGEGSQNGEDTDRYSRKVFVGGLPPDIDEDEIQASFRKYGPLVVDWPHKNESRSYFPPKGYAFLLFQDEVSVHGLVQVCVKEDDKLFTTISSPTIKDKAVQIRPWNLSDSDYVMDGSAPLDPRKTIFVGGVPRPLRAVELAIIMERLYGSVCYAGIDTDPELKYPKGAGRVAFSSQQSYIAAISARFVQLQYGDIDKRVEVKPYVLDDQMCDECAGQRCGGKFAPFFCANVNCLQVSWQR